MEKIYKETMDAQKAFDANYKSNETVNTEMYGAADIQKDYNNQIQKYKNFAEDLSGIQKHKHRFQIWLMILFLLFALIGIAGFWIRRDIIPWICFLCLFLLAIPIFIIAGVETSHMMLSIDFCCTIGNSIISGVVPFENKGLGTYFSCPSKDTSRTIATAVYQYALSYNLIYQDMILDSWQLEKYDNEKIIFGRYEENKEEDKRDKRNNTEFEILIQNLKKAPEIDEEIKNNMIFRLQNLILINRIMAGLLSLSKCRSSRNDINYIEEKYCAINHPYMARNIVFLIFVALGYLILSSGLNKLIIVMKSHYARALRGKGEFNNDIIDDDDD